MEEHSGLHTHGRLSLAYRIYGSGPATVITFHGFGQDATAFEPLLRKSSAVRVISFDLFYHGASRPHSLEYAPRRHLTSEEWSGFIKDFITTHGIDRPSLMGYSMGARLVLSLLEEPDLDVREAILIAPDGFIENPWYRLATRSTIGNRAFRSLYIIRRPLHLLGRALIAIRLLDEKLYRVSLHNTATKERCIQLYNTWTFLRCIRPDVERVGEELEMRLILIKVHLGRYDRLIIPDKVLEWSYLRRNPARATIHQAGHDLLRPHLSSAIMGDSTNGK